MSNPTPAIGDRSALRLPSPLRRDLERRSREGYPHEVCGVLVGRIRNGAAEVERVIELPNLATDRLADRYVMDPDGLLAADLVARRDGLDIVGIWHTHPDHPARPSKTDLDAAWEGYSYVIVSVERGRVDDLRSWRLVGGAFVEEPISPTEPTEPTEEEEQ